MPQQHERHIDLDRVCCRSERGRVPSEIIELKWSDESWDRMRLTVKSSKTEGIEGHAVREVPIDPRLLRILQDLFDSAEPGNDQVIQGVSYSTNLRTTMTKILARAGVTVWPRLFHALRASCACDWVDRFPEHVTAGWLGHSPRVAAEHYLQTRDEHIRLASQEVVPNGGAQSGAHGAQNPAQHATAD